MNLEPLKRELGREEGERVRVLLKLIEEGEEVARFFPPLLEKAKKMGFRVTREFPKYLNPWARQQALGMYLDGQIYLSPFISDNLGVKVLAHELGHAYFYSPSEAEAETLAEATSFLVTQALGMDIARFSAQYIKGFKGGMEFLKEEELYRVAGEIVNGVKE